MATKKKKKGQRSQREAPSPARIEKQARAPGEHATAQNNALPVVGIGASAGGLEAMQALFGAMPERCGMAFIVVSHMLAGHTTLLPELLAKCTAMPVAVVTDNTRIEADHVYVGPPGDLVAVFGGTLHVMGNVDGVGAAARQLPIDYFLRSLAADQKQNAIAIILSGTGTDGTLGLKAIKGEAGMVMAQDAESAKYSGMPVSAAATGMVDYILAPADMPKQLLAYARGMFMRRQSPAVEASAVPEDALHKIFVLLRSRTGHDFSCYKPSTIQRRVERRLNVHQITEASRYVRFLQENAHELDVLFKELLIGVTAFFRDPEAFNALAEQVIGELVKERPDDHTIRVWVAGCSTGEEAYSIAILLCEWMEKLKRRLEVQIFATDLDQDAIETARAGVFPAGIAVDVSAARLERFFVRKDHGYQVRKDLRDMIIFALQNVVKDPPFTRLDLVSCRNVLIYLNNDLQNRLFPIFHYALKPDGWLFLGPSETIGRTTEMFDVVDRKWRIFRRRETGATVPIPPMPVRPARAEPGPPLPSSRSSAKEGRMVNQIERLMLARFAPASVVVDQRGDIFYFHGRTGAYLEPTTGQPRWNVLEMAREGLDFELAAAIRQAAREDKEVTRPNVRIKSNGDSIHVDITVVRLSEPESVRGLLLVSFRPSVPQAPVPRGRSRPSKTEDERIKQLQREVQYAKESLQTTVEELETSNEELTSANEELQSTNEELQSTNEELETSKEEMQSLNEELTTVNAELQAKVDELSDASAEVQNLLNSIGIGVVFLDEELNIVRYSEQAKRIFNLIQGDIGRPISDLISNLKYDRVAEDCRSVLNSLTSKEVRVALKNDSSCLMRMMPYRTLEDTVGGLVITFVELSNPGKESDARHS